jgi:putative transposase
MSQIELSVEETVALEHLVRRGSAAHRLVVRAKIILKLAAGENNSQIARQLEIDRGKVLCWRGRWQENWGSLKEQVSEEKSLSEMVEEVLSDKVRSGAPSPFTAEQIVQIIALACEKPEESSRPISHWSSRELADEALKRKIVEQISPRSIGRFLKTGGLKT